MLLSRYLVSSTPHTMNKDKIHGRTRTRPSIQKVDPNFSIPITNIKILPSNYPEVKLHLQEIKLDLLFRYKTSINYSISVLDFIILFSLNRHGYGIGAYIKGLFACGKDSKNGDPDFPFMVSLIHDMPFVFTFYRSQGGIAMDDRIVIDDTLSGYSSVIGHICGDLSINHKELLVHANRTDEEGEYCLDFSIAYELTQIVDKSSCFADIGYPANTLDRVFLTCLDQYSNDVLLPLGTSNLSLIYVKVDAKSESSSNVTFYRTIYQYFKADWDSFKSPIAEIPLSAFFKNRSPRTASLISECIRVDIDSFIP